MLTSKNVKTNPIRCNSLSSIPVGQDPYGLDTIGFATRIQKPTLLATLQTLDQRSDNPETIRWTFKPTSRLTFNCNVSPPANA